PAACAGLGIAYATGKGIAPDLTYGLSLLEEACAAEPVCAWGECDGDGAVACRWMGHMYTQGAGVKASRREARQLYRRACDRGDLLSCGG
ncbi:MAG: TPR repeat protein, partial [Myxococcota bacterium]